MIDEATKNRIVTYFLEGKSARWILMDSHAQPASAILGGYSQHLTTAEIESVVRDELQSRLDGNGSPTQDARRYTFQMTNRTGHTYTEDVDAIPAQNGILGEREPWLVAVHRLCGMGGSTPQAIRLVSESRSIGDEWKPITTWDDGGKPTYHELKGGAA